MTSPSSSADNSEAVGSRILNTVVACLEEAKAEDLVQIDIQGKSALADYMVIASGRSNRHVGAICDQLLRALKEDKSGSVRVEGLSQGDWVLIDAGDVVIHVFRPEVRDFYALEKMWSEPDHRSDTVH
ncbi:MAG: ribosome silencing factor [Pseudomonadota bacterium]